MYNEEGRPSKAPLIRFSVVLAAFPRRSSDERRLAIRDQHVLVACLNCERVVLFLKPHKLGFQIAYSLLEAAHLGNDAGIRTADVAE